MTESTSNAAVSEFHEVTPSDFEIMYNEQKAQNDRLQAVIAASRIGVVSDHPQKDAKPAITAEGLTARLGQLQINRMTRSEKLAALSLDPASVDDKFLIRCFGRGNDGKDAAELHKVSPLRYRQLKEASRLLGSYCN